MKNNFSKSTRKYIRKEKARIRREVSGKKEQERLVDLIYKKYNREIKNNK